MEKSHTNQKEIWNKIAPEWSKFRTKPDEKILKFLEKKKGNILDFGSGAGRHLIKLEKATLHLIDFSKELNTYNLHYIRQL